MAGSTSDRKKKKKKKKSNSFRTNQNSNEPLEPNTSDISSSEVSTFTYQNDIDFDEAFKKLLHPIESISKSNQCELLKHDLLKELHSYLNHLKSNNFIDSSIFVEASLAFQNITLIYQKKVDQYVDVMMKLTGKFRAYRINSKDKADAERADGDNRKRREKNVDFYSSFEPIKGQIFSTLKHYNWKTINLSKKPPLPKVVFNTNIKVDNKYSKLLPYICVGNGENIGKKYDFMLNYPLDHHLAVNEEFDCLSYEDENSITPLNKGTVPLSMNLMDVDGITCNDTLLSTPDPVIFDQTVTDEAYVACAISQNRENIMNVSEIPLSIDNDGWATVTMPKYDIYPDIPIAQKSKVRKKQDSGMWLPTYTIEELNCQSLRFKSSMSVDPAFRQFVHDAQETQRSTIAKMRMKNIDKEKQQYDLFDKEMDEKLKTNEVSGFKEFDSPIYDGDLDYNFEEQVEPLEDNGNDRDNFETYQKNAMYMKKYEQNQLEMMNEQLEMWKRVQAWHDKIRPVLEEEEKRTDFDIHQYGTDVLDCFQTIGEQKSFKDLVGGLKEEEVARYFLSTLMMANTNNLKINKSSDDFDNEIKIELLKKERHHEELQLNIGNQVNHDSLQENAKQS